MDTKQINEICFKLYPNFLGCLPIDDLQEESIITQLCNDFTVGSFVIFNIDDSTKPGTHWVLLHRMIGGQLLLFDSFGAFGTDKVFRFLDFNELEKNIISSYDASLLGQLFQYSKDNSKYENDYTFSNNIIRTLFLEKRLLKRYTLFKNMSDSLYYLYVFLQRLCPGKSSHKMFYYSSQLQPFNTIVCGELCILIAQSLFRDLNTLHNKKPDTTVVEMLSDTIHTLFSTAFTDKEFVRLVKEYMLFIDPFYKVKPSNVEYFKKIFASENTKLMLA